MNGEEPRAKDWGDTVMTTSKYPVEEIKNIYQLTDPVTFTVTESQQV